MSLEAEHRALRRGVGVSVLPHVSLRVVSGDDAYERVDQRVATPLSMRDGQIRQAVVVDAGGRVSSDLYAGNDDGDLVLYGEALPELGAREDVRCLSINGPFAWELLAALEERDVIGFPYLSFYRPREGWWYFRAGKTGEFGYDLFVPSADADAFYERIMAAGRAFEAIPVGLAALRLAALENGFFTLEREGAFGLTPGELQLSWRLSYKKQDWPEPARRITYFFSEDRLTPQDPIRLEEERIGMVLVSDRSPLLDRFIGIALLDRRWAYSGIDAFTAEHQGERVRLITASSPFVHNLSTFLKPGHDCFARRDAIAFPGWSRS